MLPAAEVPLPKIRRTRPPPVAPSRESAPRATLMAGPECATLPPATIANRRPVPGRNTGATTRYQPFEAPMRTRAPRI